MKAAVLLHLHYPDLWPEFWSYLKDIKDENTDLYVTVHQNIWDSQCYCYNKKNNSYLIKKNPKTYNDIKNNSNEIFVIENKGQDFGGFLYAYNKIKHKQYDVFIKLHGKKSLRFGSNNLHIGENWRKNLYMPLIGTKQIYQQNLQLFEMDKTMFMAGSKKYMKITGIQERKIVIDYHSQITWVDEILETSTVPRKVHISGSMFMVSSQYLDIFFKNKESEILLNMEEGYSEKNSGIHLECLICNCEHFGGKLLGV